VLALAIPADAAEPPPANARFDYQIGGDYGLPSGVRVVSRDWFAGRAPRGTYAICYGSRVIAIEYRRADFARTCRRVGSRISVVLRDVGVTRPGSRSYVYDSC
jgi:hypothetical protein